MASTISDLYRADSFKGIDRTIVSISIFFVLFTSDIKFSTPLFEGIPIWIPVAIPMLAYLAAARGDTLRALVVFSISVMVLFIHLLLSRLFILPIIGELPITRSLVQIFVLSVCVSLAATVLSKESNYQTGLLNAVKIFLVIQSLLMIAMVLMRVHTRYDHYFLPISRVSGLFTEPSHVAIAMSAPLAIMIGFPKLWRDSFGAPFSAAVFIILVLCPSASMVWPILGGFVVLSIRSGAAFALSFPILGIAFGILPSFVASLRYSNEIMERVYDAYSLIFLGVSSDKLNVSAIVLAKGVYVLKSTLSNLPIGTGIDNLYYGNVLYGLSFSKYFGHLNMRDSSSILVKVGSEFGWIGICCIISCFVFLSYKIYSLRSSSYAIIVAVALSALISNCGRGAGYFDFGFIFVPAVTIALTMRHRLRNGAAF